MIYVLILLLLISFAAFLILQRKVFGKSPGSDERERIIASPNYTGNAFVNPVPTKMHTNPLKILKVFTQSRKTDREPPFEIPLVKHNKDGFTDPPSQELKLMWLGHVSFLIEMAGKRILLDTVVSERVSPFGFAGPKRFHEPPLPADELPHIDLFVISHNHYDHMDYSLIRKLKDRDIHFVTSLGLESTLKHWGVGANKITSLDWHESFRQDGLEIIATPSRHFSGRSPFDRNKTFWCSYVVRSEDQSIYYEADSGYFDGFREIGEKYGPFDLSLMGIGAYNDLWAVIHTFPEEAVKGHLQLNAGKMIPIHWCTFNLAVHPWIEPIERTVHEAKKKNVELIIPIPGEWVIPGKKQSRPLWWNHSI